MLSDLFALQEGILQATITLSSIKDRPKSIDEALASMTPQESEACRRKFRKILRKLMKKNGTKINKKTKRQRREFVMFEMRSRAWDFMLHTTPEDNDEI
jgi:uncharacterized membrane protein